MTTYLPVIAAVGGYLLGSISFARVVGRIVAPGEDLNSGAQFATKVEGRELTMQAVSATTLGNRAGAKAGGIAGILDVLKILVPAVVLRVLYPEPPYFLIFVLTGMVGHIWPLYYRFRGGRGLSVALAGFLVTDVLGTVVMCVVGTAFGLLVLRDAMTTFLGWIWLMIPWLWFRTHDWRYAAFAAAVSTILFVAMIPEIKVYARYHREGIALGFEDAMQTTPMGRGIWKTAVRLRLLKDTPHKEERAA